MSDYYDRHDGLMLNVRVAVVECRDVNRIPVTLPWIFEARLRAGSTAEMP